MNKPSKHLTEKQRRLVEDNVKLAHFIKNKWLKKNIRVDYHELDSACMFGLTKAGLYFDETKGIKFATFATVIINNEVKGIFRKNHYNRSMPLSAVVVRHKNEKDQEFNIMDIYGSHEDKYLFMEKEYLNDLLETLPKRDRDIMWMHYITQEQQYKIGKLYNLSQSMISRRIRLSLKKMKEHDEKLMK